MSDAYICPDKSLAQSLTLSSTSSASSLFDLPDQTSHSDDLHSVPSDAQPSSSANSEADVNMSVSTEQARCIDTALHCEEESALHLMTSPQNSDLSALSHLDAAFLTTPWTSHWKQQLTQPAVHISAPKCPCLAEVPTEAIYETVNVACLGELDSPSCTSATHC